MSITVMFETWPEDSAPNYSVQTTHLKKGTVDHAAKAWSTYGGRVGVWRLMRTFERLGVPATFFVNARCTEVYPTRSSRSPSPASISPRIPIRRTICRRIV